MKAKTALIAALLAATHAAAQKIPDASCVLEDYNIKSVLAWQATQVVGNVQVVVLRDPAGEQEARFDLLHGASLVSLKYRGKELLYGQSAGASVGMFAANRAPAMAGERKPRPYWTAYAPDQGGASMGVPATTAGVACNGQQSMRAFAMMIDRGVDNSLQKDPLIGVWQGKSSDNFPPGYSTHYTIETNASWVENPGGSPRYYLKLDQSVVNVRPVSDGALEWYLTGAAPWDFQHAASYPEACTETKPCSSATTKALVAGRYEDTARTSGVATVVPTAAFRSSNAYVRPNAEYVVLLYGAVWAAPRHTFATVLERPLDGVGSFQFSWYVCAGAFDQARAFADKQPAMQGDVLPRMASAPAPAIPTHNLVAVPAACQVTEYKMQPNQPEQAVILKDPAGEQTVLFDVTQGGAIVSHKYKGQESVWGYNGGGLLQMAFHNGMTRGPWSGDYNPTQAGDGSAMSPVTGIACEGTSAVNILTMMLDFNHNNAFYDRPLIAVWGGRVNDMAPLSFFSPYTLETRARWVPNPAGEPKYYLKMEERLVHIADEKIGNFGFDFAYYADWGLGIQAVSPAEGKQANYVAGGFYKDDAHTVGMAVGMPSSNFPGKKVGGGGTTEPMWRNHSFHLGATDTVDGITSKEFVWYIMAGPWKNAEAFAKKF